MGDMDTSQNFLNNVFDNESESTDDGFHCKNDSRGIVLQSAKHFQFAVMMERCCQYHKAEQHYKKAHQLLPHNLVISFQLAHLLQRRQCYNEAQHVILCDIIPRSFFLKTFLSPNESVINLETPLVPLLDVVKNNITLDIIACALQYKAAKHKEIIESQTAPEQDVFLKQTFIECPKNRGDHGCCCAFCIGPLINLAVLHIRKSHAEQKNSNSKFSLDVLEALEALGYDAPELVVNLSLLQRQYGRRKDAIQLVLNHLALHSKDNETRERINILREAVPLGVSMNFCNENTDVMQLRNQSALKAKHAIPVDDDPNAKILLTESLSVCCVKWGNRFDSIYVVNLYKKCLQHLHFKSCQFYDDHRNSNACITDPECSCKNHFKFFCFTENFDDDFSQRHPNFVKVPLQHFEAMNLVKLKGWWIKAYLFSDYASSLLFPTNLSSSKQHYTLYLDLDVVVTGNLIQLIDEYLLSVQGELDSKEIASFDGLMATLGTDEIYCEIAKGGINSSVMLWTSPLLLNTMFHQRQRNIFYMLIPRLTFRYIHRFDFWLETLFDVDNTLCGYIDKTTHGIKDYKASLLNNEFCREHKKNICRDNDNKSEHPSDCEQNVTTNTAFREEQFQKSKLIIFPRSPKPHEVWFQHPTWMPRF